MKKQKLTVAKSKKTKKGITPDVLPPRKEGRLDYVLKYSFKQVPVSDAFLEDLSLRIINKVFFDETILIMNQIFHSLDVLGNSVYLWAKRSRVLKAALAFAKEVIGTRREHGMYLGRYPAAPIMKTLHMYSKEWDAHDRYHAALKADLIDKIESSIKVVHMPAVEKPDEKHLSRQVKEKAENDKENN